MADTRPIGMFDSGVGGLTVLKEVIKQIFKKNRIKLKSYHIYIKKKIRKGF